MVYRKVSKSNLEKYQVVLNTNNERSLKLKDWSISNSSREKWLGIKIDYELSFKPRVESLCEKTSRKVNALSQVASSSRFK